MRSLHYLNWGTLPPFPDEPEHGSSPIGIDLPFRLMLHWNRFLISGSLLDWKMLSFRNAGCKRRREAKTREDRPVRVVYDVPMRSIVTLFLALPLLAQTPGAVITPKEKIALFNGKDLDGWYTWLKENKYRDPKHVFTVQDGAIRVS